jgi:hypothetical protein
MTRTRLSLTALLCALAVSAAAANQPPEIEHQPSPCTVAGQPISFCASITDDNQVARARIHFKRAGEQFYSYVEMDFRGLNYCATLPAPREGKVRQIEYYVQAIDDQYEPVRTSTYQLAVQPEGACEFPPLEKDAARKGAITVYATNKKQGKKLPDGFDPTGVTFVPVAEK